MPRRSSLASFLRYSRLGFSGSCRDITPPQICPVSAMTGQREVNARCSEDASGGIIPFRGRGATCIAPLSISAVTIERGPVLEVRLEKSGLENKEIARILGETADLMEIAGEDSFRIRSYRNGATA